MAVNNWRKLTKREIIHLLEGMADDDKIIATLKQNRVRQKTLAARSPATREVCWDCKHIAERLGLE